MARAMKNSNVEWLGMIPETWSIGKIGQVYTERREKVSDEDFPPLSVTMQGIVPQLSSAAKTDAHDNRKLVKVGDFAINSRSDRRGSCGISEYDGSVSLINTVLQPRKKMNPDYYNWVFHSAVFSDEYYKWGHGIVDDLWTTNWQEMKRISIPMPPIEEQDLIAKYLKNECEEIDLLYNETNKSIEEYKKLKQIIITNATTQGLSSCKYKKSGLEWIDSIPDNWSVQKLKNYFEFGKGLPITKDDLVETGIPVISYGQVHSKTNSGVGISEDLIRYVNASFMETNLNSIVSEGDFIFADTSEDLAGCGNCVFVDDERTLFAGYHTIIFKPKNRKKNKYLAYLFLSDVWRNQIRSRVSGIKLFSITQRILKETTIILPGDKEQQEIVDYLDEKCGQIDEIIKFKSALLKELEIMKKSMIYDYISGKREVK